MIPVLVKYYYDNIREFEFVGLFDLATEELLCPEIQSENIIMVREDEGWRSSDRYSWFCYITQANDIVWEAV